MPEESSREYFAARAANARMMAAKAIDPHIARIHTEMAARYDELAERAEPERPELHVLSG